mmetsp:Transcript_3005/g.5661  ORF Transcript_3005/g.5661 Transcript_3005/m.5661 type:complete len:123 (-) Transcript_3005:1257-1625(-)
MPPATYSSTAAFSSLRSMKHRRGEKEGGSVGWTEGGIVVDGEIDVEGITELVGSAEGIVDLSSDGEAETVGEDVTVILNGASSRDPNATPKAIAIPTTMNPITAKIRFRCLFIQCSSSTGVP